VLTRGRDGGRPKKVLDKVEKWPKRPAPRGSAAGKYPRELGRRGIESTTRSGTPRSARLALETTTAGEGQRRAAGLKADRHKRRHSRRRSPLGRGDNDQRRDQGPDGVDGAATACRLKHQRSIDVKLPRTPRRRCSAFVNGGISSPTCRSRIGEGSRRKLDGTINRRGTGAETRDVNGRIRVGGVS